MAVNQKAVKVLNKVLEAGFTDEKAIAAKIEVKIIVSCVHKLTTLYLQNATVIFYRNVSSYRTV